jgi:hypothetical protein
MCLVVIVDKLGDGSVVATAEHAGGSGLGFNCGQSSVVKNLYNTKLYIHFFS